MAHLAFLGLVDDTTNHFPCSANEDFQLGCALMALLPTTADRGSAKAAVAMLDRLLSRRIAYLKAMISLDGSVAVSFTNIHKLGAA